MSTTEKRGRASSGRLVATAEGRRVRPLVAGDSWRVMGPMLLVMIALALFTNSRNPAYLTGSNLQNILLQASVLGIVAIGQTYLLIGRQLDLSVGSAVSLYGMVAARLVVGDAPLPEWLILVIVMALGGAIGMVWGLIVAYLRVPPFILTLGGLSVLSSIALILSRGRPIPLPGSFQWLGLGRLAGIRVPIIIFVSLAVVTALVLRYTRFGRHVYALGSGEEAAYLAGVPTRRTKIIVFAISGVLVGLAGIILLARIGAGDPRSGTGLELRAIAAVVLGGATLSGGRGSVQGTFAAVLLLGVVQSSLNFLAVSAFYQDLVFGGVLIFAVVTTAVGELRRERAATTTGGLLAGAASLWKRPPATQEHGSGSKEGADQL